MSKDTYKHSSIDKFIKEIKNGFQPLNLNEVLKMSDYKFINRFTLEQFDKWVNVPCSRECQTCMLGSPNNGTNLVCVDYVKTMPFEKLLKYGYIRIPVEYNPKNYIKPEAFNTLCDIKENITLIKRMLAAVELKAKNLIGDD